MTQPNQRFAVELRAEVNGNRLVGHAATFHRFAEMPGHLERLAPSAFNAALADPQTDVRALYEHDPSKLLGRQSSGTLRLDTDREGLRFEIDLPDTQLGRDLKTLISRGDLNSMSFAFIAGDEDWSTVDGHQVRTHTSVASLHDISIVGAPAYREGTSVMLRSLTDIPTSTHKETLRSQLIRARARVHLARKVK